MSISFNTNSIIPVNDVLEDVDCYISVKNSNFEIENICLNEEDIFSLENFESLIKNRFEQNLDFYLVVVKEGSKFFLFEAAKFIEYFISKKEINPFTNQPINNFEVLWLTKESKEFEHFAMKDAVIDYPNYLQIYWNDHLSSIERRRSCIFTLGRIYEKGEYGLEQDKEIAISLYETAFEMGSVDSASALGQLYSFS